MLLHATRITESRQYTFIAQFGGRHEDLSNSENACLSTNWVINCLLYRKLKHDVDVIQRRALCRET